VRSLSRSRPDLLETTRLEIEENSGAAAPLVLDARGNPRRYSDSPVTVEHYCDLDYKPGLLEGHSKLAVKTFEFGRNGRGSGKG